MWLHATGRKGQQLVREGYILFERGESESANQVQKEGQAPLDSYLLHYLGVAPAHSQVVS